MATRRTDRSQTGARGASRGPAPQRSATASGISAPPRSATASGISAPPRSATASGISAPPRAAGASGLHAPVAGAPERRTTGSAAGSAPGRPADGSGHQKQAGAKGRPARPGMGLRAKFMLVLAGVTAAALIALGVTMSLTTNSFLFGQKQHSGVEIARFAAQLATAVNSKLEMLQKLKKTKGFEGIELPLPTQGQMENEMRTMLDQARDWFGNGDLRYTDVLAVRYDSQAVPEISGSGVGDVEEGAALVKDLPSIYVPKTGQSVGLTQGVQVSQRLKKVGGVEIPIYRFKIALDPIFGRASRGDGPANVRVDIAADSVERVRNNLFVTIGIAVFIAIGVVIAVANWLAGNITRPLDILISDMKTVARGRLDHETKARSTDEIGLLANEFNRMTQNLRVAQVALVEQEKAEYELSIAREVQRQLLPAEAPQIAGYDTAAFYQGAKAVSGDYFDYIPLGNGLWGFIIADVSGKGIPGSMVMAVTRTIVRLVANKYQNRAADTLKETNKLIAKQIKRGMFVTALYAILDERTGALTYASAGHNPMAIYRAATKTYEMGTGKGIALGFNEGPIFDKTIQEMHTTIGPGDAIVLFTDGFPEAMNADNQEFGEEKFYETIGRYGQYDARTCIAKLVADIAAHRGEAEQSDDLTIIAVRNVGGAA
jgi:serine phosphatase RsbU (regulator of sigma subunit)